MLDLPFASLHPHDESMSRMAIGCYTRALAVRRPLLEHGRDLLPYHCPPASGRLGDESPRRPKCFRLGIHENPFDGSDEEGVAECEGVINEHLLFT